MQDPKYCQPPVNVQGRPDQASSAIAADNAAPLSRAVTNSPAAEGLPVQSQDTAPSVHRLPESQTGALLLRFRTLWRLSAHADMPRIEPPSCNQLPGNVYLHKQNVLILLMRSIGSCFATYPARSRSPRLTTFNHSCTLHRVDLILKALLETLVHVSVGGLQNAVKAETICCMLL